jgi:hypothetical protein
MIGTPSMKRLKNLKVIAAAAVLVLVAAACGAGEVSGGGSADSAISSRGKISFAIETKGLCVRGTERECADFPAGGNLQLVKGEYRDSGKSAAWPYGVSMKFEGPLNSYSKDIAQSGAATDCPTNGLTCWVGGVGYRSGDERHYPNTGAALDNCMNSSAGAVLQSPAVSGSSSSEGESTLARAAGEEVSRLQERMREDSKRSDHSKLATGIAIVLIVDTNRNGEIDSDDRRGRERDQFLLISLCGPYSGQPVQNVLGETYSYTSCPALRGIFDTSVTSETQVEFAEACLAPLRSGNFKIKMLPPTTTTTTTTVP